VRSPYNSPLFAMLREIARVFPSFGDFAALLLLHAEGLFVFFPRRADDVLQRFFVLD